MRKAYAIIAEAVIPPGAKAEAWKWMGCGMIEVTRLNGSTVLVNAELIELVEETPDTVLSFVTGKKLIVKESRQEKFSNIIQERNYGNRISMAGKGIGRFHG